MITIEELTAYNIDFYSASGVFQIAPSSWTNDNDPYIRIAEPSGQLVKGYSISIVGPSGDITYVPDEDEVTDDPGGAWFPGGVDFQWDVHEDFGWEKGRWDAVSGRQNYWDIETQGAPPSGIPPS